MAIAFVQSPADGAVTASGTSLAKAFASNVTAGSLIVVAWRYRVTSGSPDPPRVVTITDTLGNTYVSNAVNAEDPLDADSTNGIGYAMNSAAGACTVTVSVSGDPCLIRMCIDEFSGAATTDALDQTATAVGSSTTPASGAVTPTSDGQLLFAATHTSGDAGGVTPGTDFTQGTTNTAAIPRLITEYYIQPTAASHNGNFTIATSRSWGCVMATFKAASADPGKPFVTQLGSQMVAHRKPYPSGFYSFALGTPLPISAAIPFNQSSWPIPPHANKTLLITISTQQQDPNPETPLHLPFSQHDWPNPRRKAPLNVSWTQQRVAGTPILPLLPGPPFTQLEWPLPPRRRNVPTASLGFVGFYALSDAAPLRATMTTMLPPPALPWPISLRTWMRGRPPFLEDTQPFMQIDWPMPSRRLDTLVVSSWHQGRSLLLLEDLKPFNQTRWPAPPALAWPIRQRTWTQSILGSPLSLAAGAGWGPRLAFRRNRLVQGGA